MEAAARLAAAMREQERWCRDLGSPLYAGLLACLAADLEAGGPSLAALAGHEDDPPGSALALRLLAAVHRLVLEGRAPALARHYPSAGGDAPSAGGDARRGDPWPAFGDLLAAAPEEVRRLVALPVQTNEPGRSAALLGGFLVVAAETGLPLRLLEIGASAGLNLRWDHFRYEAGDAAWGDAASPVRLAGVFADGRPPLEVAASVASRAGCDLAPLDATTREGELALRAYLWPDQDERHALLTAAVAVARQVPATVERADAPAWLGRALATPAAGVASVVYHSIFWQYLSRESRGAARAAIEEAGRRATSEAPLAWLRFEPAGREGPYQVRLTTWPGGVERVLAEAGPHGCPVRWLAPAGGSAAPRIA